MLERIFRLRENRTTARTELVAGLTTFMTMSYIIVVQPAVLSGVMFGQPTGMDFGAITTATCLAAALASAIMGLYARYPIAQAPGMGENFFFVFSAIPAAAAAGSAVPWATALGAVFISGLLFLALSLAGAREAVMNAISPSLKHAIAGGIGLFIAFIGLQNAGVIIKDPGTAVKLSAHFATPGVAVFCVGLLVAAGLRARGIRGSILWGILAAGALAVALGIAMPPDHFVSLPPSIAPTLFQMDVRGAATLAMAPFVLIFLFMVFFDTVGTLVGVAQQAGLMHDNKLPRARQAFLSDAVGTVAGACLGTSTVTSYIESATGIEQGGRTGLTAVTVSCLFLLALFFSPVIATLGSCAPVTAPALVLVGAMMLRNVAHIDWDDFTELLPSFLVLIGIPLSYSIADGLTLGFVSYPLVKVLGGRSRDVRPASWVIAILLLLYLVLVRSQVAA